MYRICQSYQLTSISIFSLSSVIIISVKSPEEQYGTRQVSVPFTDKHLEKLNRFNQLSLILETMAIVSGLILSLYMFGGFIQFLREHDAMLESAANCGLALIGLSIGFVLISTFTYYRRVYFLSKGLASHLLRHPHKKL